MGYKAVVCLRRVPTYILSKLVQVDQEWRYSKKWAYSRLIFKVFSHKNKIQ